MSKTDSYLHFSPDSISELRDWLQLNHDSLPGAWIIFWKKCSNKPYIPYSDFVDELLCYGWIDSTIRPINKDSYRQLITPRKPKSVWSKVNKDKIDKLISEDRLMPKALESITIAKENGSWSILDSVERLEVPNDLQSELIKIDRGLEKFEALPRSMIKLHLQHLVLAKREATRAKRIESIIEDISKI
ncbi:MAG: YdeI/OmpD-associated family protein [Bacteroidales bacterium]